MADRLPLLSVIVSCSLAPALHAQPQAGPPPPTAKTLTQTLPSDVPADLELSIEEAIRSAIKVFDLVEAGEEVQDLQPLSEQASRLIEVVRAKDPGNPWLAYLNGRFYAFTGRRMEAVEQLRKFVETREGRNEWRAHRLLGDMFVDEYPRLAEAGYQRAASLNPDEPSTLFGLSRCAFRLGDMERAVDLGRRAVNADRRRDLRYVAQLATLLKTAGRLDEARQEAESAVALARRRTSERPGSRSALLAADSQYRLLIEILEALISEPGNSNPQDYLRLATCLRERGQIAEMLVLHDALRVLETGVERTAPGTPPSLLEQRAVALAEVGRDGEAISAFEKLLEADPNNDLAKTWLRRLRPEGAQSDAQRKQEP